MNEEGRLDASPAHESLGRTGLPVLHSDVAQPHADGLLPAVQSLLYLVVVALFVMTFTVQPFRIPSESMEPTLLVGDFLLVSKQQAGRNGGSWMFPPDAVRRRDVVVFHYPLDAHLHLVKRVVGLPGDRIQLRSGHVYIDGRELGESYAEYRPAGTDEYRDDFPRMDSPNPGVAPAWWIRMRDLVHNGELTIPPDAYFVLGDNRNDSADSRYWGLVPRNAIVGKPLVVYVSVRETTPGERPRQGAGPGWASRLAGIARWDRTLKVVR